MEEKNKKTNIFLLLLAPFKYFFLGVYYTLYAIFYPFIFIYNRLTSSIYKSYSDKKHEKDKKEVINAVNLEMTSIDDKIKKNNELKEQEVIREKELKKDKNLSKQQNKIFNKKNR